MTESGALMSDEDVKRRVREARENRSATRIAELEARLALSEQTSQADKNVLWACIWILLATILVLFVAWMKVGQ